MPRHAPGSRHAGSAPKLRRNTQALFRPCSMTIPDYALVAEVMLLGEGFECSGALGRKVVQLYKLASEQLSQQVRRALNASACARPDQCHGCEVSHSPCICVRLAGSLRLWHARREERAFDGGHSAPRQPRAS